MCHPHRGMPKSCLPGDSRSYQVENNHNWVNMGHMYYIFGMQQLYTYICYTIHIAYYMYCIMVSFRYYVYTPQSIQFYISNCIPTSSLCYSFVHFFFFLEDRVTTNLKLAVQLSTTLNFDVSCLSLPNAEVKGLCNHPGYHTCQASSLLPDL